jgi:hypothetical protein
MPDLTHPLTTPASSDALAAAVGTGVGSLSGWGAAFLVIVLLAGIAWWATRPSGRKR